MNRPEVVSFDCAQTLIEVNWIPSQLAIGCAKRIGLDVDEQIASERYSRLLQTRWPLFTQLNLARSEAVCQEFWREITYDWVAMMGWEPSLTEPMMAAGDEMLYGPDSKIFQIYDDVLPCLDQLQKAGIRMVIISNWDNSLHRVVNHFGLKPYFELVVASLEEGVEKPEPGIFQVALNHTGVPADRFVHIGDNPLDDIRGAMDVGMDAWLIDRSLETSEAKRLATLADLPSTLGI